MRIATRHRDNNFGFPLRYGPEIWSRSDDKGKVHRTRISFRVMDIQVWRYFSVVGAVVWITGLAASGKTTFMEALAEDLHRYGLHPIQLDGDQLRPLFRSENMAYDYEGRLALGRQYSDLCRMLASQGHLVLIATIALFHEVHQKNRRDLPNYMEVLMDTPLDVVQARDPKGIYAGQNSVGGTDVVGVAWDAEFPTHPDFRIPPSAVEYELGMKSVRERIVGVCGTNAGSGRGI